MEVKYKLLIAVSCGLAVGLVIGGLAGHFSTKTNIKSIGSSTASQTEISKLLIDVSRSELEETLRYVTKNPHLAGDKENNKLGDWMRDRWKGYGMRARSDDYDVLLSYPGGVKHRNKAQIMQTRPDGTEEIKHETEAFEPALDSEQNINEINPGEMVTPFNAYAKPGTVQSSVVYYVNYCRDEDFKKLVDVFIPINGSMAICRLGENSPGGKTRTAQKYNITALLLFHDPEDYQDNATLSGQTQPYPESWWLPSTAAQKGTLLKERGDPLTPGFPAKDYAYRKSVKQIRDEGQIPDIPTHPLSYGAASLFMSEMSGDEVDDEWKGELRFINRTRVIYRYGGALAENRTFRIVNNNQNINKKISNIIGVIDGAEEPDRYVLIGNHRDAWMFGATDPGTGTSVMMEISRVIYRLVQTGWRPRRTIIFCSWDGEEYGLIGSHEWLEEMQALLSARAVSYINCDSAVVYNQILKVSASPLMHQMIFEAAKRVPHPEAKFKNLYEGWYEETANKSADIPQPSIRNLGAGTDYEGFIHSYGITSADFNYFYNSKRIKVSDYFACYHTAYDRFLLVKKFVDPEFKYHQAITRLLLQILYELSTSTIVPFDVITYSEQIRLGRISLIDKLGDKLNAYQQELNYLERAVTRFSIKAKEFQKRLNAIDKTDNSTVRRINDQLMLLERSFLYPLGILDRKYVRHVIFSMSEFYGRLPFPGIADSITLAEKAGFTEEANNTIHEEFTKAIYAVENGAKFLNNVTEFV